MAEKLGVADDINFVGNMKEVYKYYNSAEIFVLTSNYEGFPNALIEAMHFGLACISTDCPTGPAELIDNEINGFLIPMNNVTALADKLEILIKDKNTRELFGNKAIDVVSKFEMQKVIIEWQNVFSHVID